MSVSILYGVPIYTMDPEKSVAEAVVIANDKIVFTGKSDEAFRLFPLAERNMLHGGCIVPGFIDAHIHIKEFSLLFRDIDLSNIYTRGEILERIKEASSQKEHGEWVTAGGCDFSILSELTRKEIDTVCANNPLIIYSLDLHSALANSNALSQAGIDKTRKDPMGGRIERDVYNNPTGLLRERAVELVRITIPEEQTGDLEMTLERGIDKLLEHGITGFCECSAAVTSSPMSALTGLWREGRLKARCIAMIDEEKVSQLGKIGIPSSFGDGHLRIGGLKLIIDGSLSSLTAYMSMPYRQSDSNGMLLMEEEELFAQIEKSYSHSLWAAVHAIGDKANEIALNCFQKVSTRMNLPHSLKRIEHAQCLQDSDVERFAPIGVIAVVNPNHIPMDREKGVRALGSDARLLHRYGSLLASGAVLALGSDAPVAPIDPMYMLYCAVGRKTFEDGPELRFYPKEGISLNDALYSYTMGSAMACGCEHEIGSIEPGKHADLVLLSADPFSAASYEALKETVVLRTYVDGRLIFEKVHPDRGFPSQ